MRQKLLLLLLCAVLFSCSDNHITESTDKEATEHNQPKGVDGMMTIKLQSTVLSQIDNQINELPIPTGNADLDQYLKSVGAYKLKRVFPFAGKHEEMQISENLNAWYTVWMNESEIVPSNQMMGRSNFSNIIAFVEPVYEPSLEAYTVTPTSTAVSRNTGKGYFNDPLFYRQWNFFNNGTVGNYQSGDENIISSIAGADINIIPAWAEETGRPDVIVSIVDGGVDIFHEDLIDNLWINEGEIAGNGIDDDNNGYVDDIYGYNFVDENGIIEPHDHGTHVAGVIAAKNNNGLGISSIAGGNGSANSGVRIMSSQIFKHNPDYNPSDPNSRPNLTVKSYNHIAAAIVYGANNGAAISQNSWGYDVGVRTPQVVKEAIEYFNKYAGHGQKKPSLMQGGLVIFAASNDNTEFKTYPAAEPDVVAVAAYAPDFSATWYTNYGSWVDISAPGGSSRVGNKYPNQGGEMTSGILSTIISEKGESRYGFMQGTSMAAPHVSGIASLILSKYGNPEFTNTELKQRLLTSVKKINVNNYNTNLYFDKLGKGFIDAKVALSEYDEKALPGTPIFANESIKTGYSSITLAWKSALASGQKDLNIDSYIIYISEGVITQSNYQSQDVEELEIPANFSTPNDILERTITNLESGKTYYFAMKSFARNGKSSELVIYEGGLATLNNRAPVITPNIDLSQHIELAGSDILEVKFTVKDPENHKWDYTFSNSAQLFQEQKGDEITVRIFAEKYYKGNHQIVLTVKDEYGATNSTTLYFTIKVKTPPRLKNDVNTLNLPINQTRSFELKDIIEDEDTNLLKFKIDGVSNNNISASLNNSTLLITPNKAGESEVSFTVIDKHSQSTKIKLPVFVYRNEGIYNLYPTIASNTIYVKIGEIVDGSIKLRIRDVMGRQVKEESFHTNQVDPIKRTLLVNVASLSAGKYELSITNSGKTYKETFVKE